MPAANGLPDYDPTGFHPPENSGYQVVRLVADFNDETTHGGLIKFKIYDALEDTLGNLTGEEWFRDILDIDS